MQAHHHHAGDPEEDDVEAGDQHIGRIEARQLRRLVRPAERRERPQRRREPGVEHVFVAAQLDCLAVVLVGLSLRFGFVRGDEHLVVRPIPRRNLVTPPQLARDAPWLDVFHPVEIGRLPVLRHEVGLALAHGGDCRLGQFCCVDVPLLGQIRLDHHVGAVAVRHRIGDGLDLVDADRALRDRQ